MSGSSASRIIGRVTALTTLWLAISVLAFAQEPIDPESDTNQAIESESVASESVEPATKPTPSDDSEPLRKDSAVQGLIEAGDQQTPLRVIGIYGSQMGNLVPDDFRPVDVNELIGALKENSRLPGIEAKASITNCTMVAEIDGATLMGRRARCIVSREEMDRTTNVPIADPKSSPLRIDMGRLNFSIRLDENAVDEDSTAALSVDEDGVVTVRIDGRQTFDYTWQQTGRVRQSLTQWDLKLPRATVVRLWIRVPAGKLLSSPDAVVRSTSRTPPLIKDWLPSEDFAKDDFAWYMVEAAGGGNVTLFCQSDVSRDRMTSPSDQSVLPADVMARRSHSSHAMIRGCRLQCAVGGGRLSWQAR